MPRLSFTRKVLLLILVCTVARLAVAAAVELGNDEVYYWTYSQHLQWNYFDHPPLVALWIRIFTLNLQLQGHELFIRLGSIVSCAIASWFIYKTTALLHSPRAGFLAACLYNASIYAGVIAGLFILPDSPQMVFWTISLYLIARISSQEKSWTLWLLLGLCTGLCIMSKVHGVFIWLGVALFVLACKRSWLRLPQLYTAAAVSLLVFSPIILWNIQNHFATYSYHSQRVTIQHFALNTDGFLREMIGQVLYNNPANFVLILMALLAVRKKRLAITASLVLYNYIAIPMAVLLIIISLFRDTLPHWSGPAYVTLLPLAAIRLSESAKDAVMPTAVRWCLGLVFFALLSGTILINFLPGTIGSKLPADLGTGDFTLDMHGWKQAGKELQRVYRQQAAAGVIAQNTPMVCYKWFPAAHEQYYFCRPLGINMIGLGTMENLHHYVWLNQFSSHDTSRGAAICVVPSNENYNVREVYQQYFLKIDSLSTIEGARNGHNTRHFYIYLLRGWTQAPPLPSTFTEQHR